MGYDTTCALCGASFVSRTRAPFYHKEMGDIGGPCPACVAQKEVERIERRLAKARHTANYRRSHLQPSSYLAQQAQALLDDLRAEREATADHLSSLGPEDDAEPATEGE